ncbi:MAG: hypothetical protein K0Q63_1626 [Paenibacillus sp.]|nr:hypothetical protein [Paenibacillus sp.]
MRKSWKIATAASMLAVMLSLSSVSYAQGSTTAYAMATDSGERTITLKEQARKWADELAGTNDESFRKWHGAWISTAPLGPGTHSWLVLLKQNQTTVGYMIIHAKDAGGYVLGEYGVGEYPPFSAQSLKTALDKLGLTGASMQARRVYVNPLQAAWQVKSGTAMPDAANVHYTDAYSGEELPVDSAGWNRLSNNTDDAKKHGLGIAHASVHASSSMPAFDPYGRLPWLTASPYSISSDPSQLIQAAVNRGEELRYVCETFEGKMLFVWSVAGYTEWSDGELFIALASEENAIERRYIPVSLLMSLGEFYR